MRTMKHVVRSAIAVPLSLSLLAGACGKHIATNQPVEKLPLLVNNRGYYDVTVYVLKSPGTSGVRVGNVSGSSTASLSVRLTDLQAGGRLVLRVRAIGSRREWISPALSIGTGATARLNVFSTNSGDLSQSSLFADY